jgi:serine/threonine-protein kinase
MSEPRIGSGNGRGDGPPTVSVDEAEEIDRLCDLFEAAWRSGGQPRFEDHLPAGDGPFRAALKAELIAIELEWRRRRETPQHRADLAAETADLRPPVPGVLETLSAGVGAVPHVLLRDTDGGPEPPVCRPGGGDPGGGTRYRIDGEIARGGMGAVLRGRDPDLGRDVALKVLREDFRNEPDMVRRFIEEAQIGGQLQHPGIVPIYEMGAFADRRPFFSMKLVKGDTLARLLAARKDPHDGLSRQLTIFEAVAQTVAYAHARGVIHRDLKPSNVMVGAFGEVQVMDWGLAKVLARGGVSDDAEAGKLHRDETVIATARSGSADSDLSRAGSVLGTPSYMAPEQARGEIERVDERVDVFALGSILCEVLTGRPAFVGRNSGEIQRTAALGDTSDALARLDASGADADLIALAKCCLAREAEDRPATAGGVSDRVTAYLAGVQDRLRRAELERVEERARRRLTTVAAAALILLSLLGGVGYAWNQRRHAERMAKTRRGVDEALADASRLLGEARSAPPGDVGRWSAAVAAATRAEGLLAQGEADPALNGRVDMFVAGVERDRADAAEKARQIEIDRALLADLESVRANRLDHRDLKQADTEYSQVFRKAGLDLDATGPDEAGRWLSSRTEPIEMAGYLDDWAFVRRRGGRPDADWQRLVSAARGGDPNPWRDALRAKFGRDDAETVAEFRRLAEDVKLEDQPASGLLLLARQLKFACNDGARAAQVLRRAARRYPGDFRVHVELALAPGATVESNAVVGEIFPEPAEAVRHLTTAIGIRPASVSTRLVLMSALLASSMMSEAESEAREAVRLESHDAMAHWSLGGVLRWQGKHEESVQELREAIRLKPDDGRFHGGLAISLRDRLKLDESLPEFREALRLRPDHYPLYLDYAIALRRKTDFIGALAVVRQAEAMRGYSLADYRYPPEWFTKLESLAALDGRLPAILKGEDRPRNMIERLDLAQMCMDKTLKAEALRFWTEALQEDPKLGDDRKAQHRYNAACAALLVASGQTKDAMPLNDAARAELRQRALAWLRDEVAAWTAVFESGSQPERATALSVIRWWTRDVDLVTVRGAEALAKLPEAERKDWQAFWVEYKTLIREGDEAQPR